MVTEWVTWVYGKVWVTEWVKWVSRVRYGCLHELDELVE